MKTIDNKEVIERIIKELKKIENDDDIVINFIPNEVVEEFHSLGFNEDYVLLKNVIEIQSKRPVKKEEQKYGALGIWTTC